MRRLTLVLGVLAVACFLPPDEHTPNGIRVLYQPNTSFRLSDQKLQEIDERIESVHECLSEDSYCTHAIPEVYITRDCGKIEVRGGGYIGGSYDPATDRIYVPKTLGSLAHEAVHHYTCDPRHGGTSLSHLCGNIIDSKFSKLYPTECH